VLRLDRDRVGQLPSLDQLSQLVLLLLKPLGFLGQTGVQGLDLGLALVEPNEGNLLDVASGVLQGDLLQRHAVLEVAGDTSADEFGDCAHRDVG
jgi:hypothetical protein